MSEPRFEHGEWDALAVGWALSALDPDDQIRFAEHLEDCDRCTATVRESLYTVADLAYAVPDDEPPPALKSRLMAAVAAEPRAPVLPAVQDGQWPLGAPHPGTPGYDPAGEWFTRPAQPPVADPGPPPRGYEPAPAAAGDRPRRRGRHSAEDVVIPFAQRRSRARRFTVAAAAAAVVALVVGLAAWNVQLRSDRDQLQSVVAQREAAISQLTANGPARVAALAPFGKPADPRQATLVVRGNQVEIIVEGLPQTTGDQTYWLWTLRCDSGTPSDLRPIRGFTVAQPEFSVRSIGSDPGLASATCFAISREIGTATPTVPRTVVLAGQPR